MDNSPPMKHDAQILNIAIGLIVLSAVFFIIERVIAGSRQRPLLRRGWLTDVCFWFFTPLVTKIVSRGAFILPALILVGLGLASVEGLKSGLYQGFGPLSRQPMWAEIIEIYVIFDFFGYCRTGSFIAGAGGRFTQCTTARRTSTG